MGAAPVRENNLDPFSPSFFLGLVDTPLIPLPIIRSVVPWWIFQRRFGPSMPLPVASQAIGWRALWMSSPMSPGWIRWNSGSPT